MPEEQIVFSHTVEGLFLRALGPKLNSKFKAKLRAAGLDLDQKLQPFYPRVTWSKLVEIAATEGFPGESPDRQYELLGQRLVQGYSDTLFGKAVLGMIRLLGPKRTLARMTSTLQSANNYSQTKLTELGPNDYTLWVNTCYGHPTYVKGIIETAMKLSGANDLEVLIQDFTQDECTLHVKWSSGTGTASPRT